MVENPGYAIPDDILHSPVPGEAKLVQQDEQRADECIPQAQPVVAKVVVRKPLQGWITGGVIVLLTLTAAGFADEQNQTASVEPTIGTDAKFIAVGPRASTTLNKAVIEGDFDDVRLLLANGSEVNAKSGAGSYHSETPLHSVAYAGHVQIAELLFAYGADVNAIDQYGYTPLRRTVEQGHLAMTELLIEKGADIVTRDSYGESLLHVVARTDHVAIARLLITGGVDINAMDRHGFTPLDYAQGSATSMVETLRQHGAICTIC